MQYLTVEQSLADIATFIRFIRAELSVGYFTKVILWGSGYGGSIATYARKKYPGLIDGVKFCLLHYSEFFSSAICVGMVIERRIRHQVVQFQ